MNHQEHLDKISDLIKDLKFTMMTTVTHEGHLHACPMTTNQFDLARKEIWFIADKTSQTVTDIQANPQVNLSYTTNSSKDYVSINGVAELVQDPTKLEELWSPTYAAFFENGKEDSQIQLIKVTPNGAEYWLSGNAVVNMFKMTAAAMSDGKISGSLGENHSVEFK